VTGFSEDLRYALRGLAKHPGFAAVAVLSLALGIGANTTIFTFVNAILLRPLPVRDLARLASVFTVDPKIPGDLGCSYPNFKDYRDRSQSFSSLLAYLTITGSLTGGDAPRRVFFQLVSGNYFQTLGVTPVAGRAFLPEEDSVPGGYPVAIISHALWKREFGADPRVMERSVEVNGYPLRIVGVAPPGFQGVNLLGAADLWIPMTMQAQMSPGAAVFNQRRALFFSVVGRLKPGVRMPAAQAELQALSQALQREYPRDNDGRRAKIVPLAESMINPQTRTLMERSGSILMIVTGLVLLIACANVANLLLSRAVGRSKEMAVRLAMGAGRAQLVRQLLTESGLLALAGGALGLPLASWARHLLWAVRPPLLGAAAIPSELDSRVLAFTLSLSLLTGLIFGLVPAWQATRLDLANDLKERSGPSSVLGPGARRIRWTLVSSEIGICVVALIGAGLFLRSLQNAQRVDPGFQADHLAMIAFNMADLRYDSAQARDLETRMLQRAAAVPGVVRAALSKDSIFWVTVERTLLVEGDPAGERRVALNSPVSPEYLRTAGIDLLRGRDFTPLDSANTPRVAILNQAAAARYWPNQNPIGRRFRFSSDDAPLQVIGIARNANYLALGEAPQALVYTPLLQDFSLSATLIVRTQREPEAALVNVTRALQALEPHLRLTSRTARSAILTTAWLQHLSAILLGSFAALALLLAALGIYGVNAYSVHQRVREIGIRMALGATPARIEMLIFREMLQVVAAGLCGGLTVAFLAVRAIRSLLLTTSPFDPMTFLLAPALLVVVAIGASWFPVLRATRIDPASALRED
jgi:predicted permease